MLRLFAKSSLKRLMLITLRYLTATVAMRAVSVGLSGPTVIPYLLSP